MHKLRVNGSGMLVYEQAQQAILKLIEERSYVAGDRIPTERDLSERFGVHRKTLRKAIDNLENDGVLERRGRSGTYIPAPVVMRPVSGHSFSHSLSQIVHDGGGIPGSKLLYFERAQASVRAASHLSVEPGTAVFVMKRLRTVNDLPFCIETTWIASDRVPGLAADDLAGDLSFYALIEERYGIKPGTAKATLNASTIASSDVELLDMKQGESALVIHSVTSDIDGQPIEYLTSLNHPRRVMFTIE